jgi:hypothetical protein
LDALLPVAGFHGAVTFRRWAPILLVAATTLSAAVAAALASVAGNAASQDLPWFMAMKRHYQWWLAASVVAMAVATLLAWWAQRRYETKSVGPEHDGASADIVAAQLAAGIGQQLRAEELRQRVHDPWPMPVPLVVTEREVMDHWPVVRGDSGDNRPIMLAGDVTDIAAIFVRIPSGRIVLLGPAGAGKTVAARRLASALTESWTSLDPVPVMAHLSSWDVPGQPLADWLEQRIVDDHPALAGRRGVIRELINDQRLLFVLDGLDEIHPSLRAAAVLAINEALASGQRLVLTSRIDEFAAAVETSDVVSGAAVLELVELDETAAFDYLEAAVPPATARRWARLRATNANKTLVEVLRSPLYVAMARVVYGTSAAVPDELLDASRQSSRAAIERTLLAGYMQLTIETMFNTGPKRLRERQHASARRWLKQIAMWSRATGDIAWWELPRLVPTAAAGMLWATITAVLAGLLWMAFFAAFNPNSARTLSGVLVGLVVGAVAGCLFFPAHADTGVSFGLGDRRTRAVSGPAMLILEVAIALTAILANGRHVIAGTGHVLRCALIAFVVVCLVNPGWANPRRDSRVHWNARWLAIISGFSAGLAVYATTAIDSDATLDDYGGIAALMTFTVSALVGSFAGTVADRSTGRAWTIPAVVYRRLRWLSAGVAVLLAFAAYGALGRLYLDPGAFEQSRAQQTLGIVALGAFLTIAGRHLANVAPVRLPHRIAPARRRLAGSVLSRVLIGSLVGFCVGQVADTLQYIFPPAFINPGIVGLAAYVDDSHPSGILATQPTIVWVGTLVGTAVGMLVGLGDWLREPADESDLPSARAVLRADRTAAIVSLVLPIVLVPIATESFAGVTSNDAWRGWAQWASDNEHPWLQRVLSGVPDTWVFNLPTTLLAVCAPALLILALPVILAAWRKLAWPQYQLAHLWLAATGRIPWRLITFLERARDAGLLRQAGSVYQFRHLRLAEYAETNADRKESRRVPPDGKD